MEDKNNLVNSFVNYYNPKNCSDEAIENRKYYSSNKAKDYINYISTGISDTKTACSKRTVPMPDILINALSDYAERQSEISLNNGINLLDKNCFVFANDDGTFRTYSRTHKIFNRFLKKYGLEKYNIHFHGLRHTYSNMLFEADQKLYKLCLVIKM